MSTDFYVYETQAESKGDIGMREVMYRALSTNNKDWIYGFPLLYGFENWIADFGGMKKNIKSKTVGQFTGLKDKNGEGIFEGDVYHQGDPRITYTVVWHDSGLIGKQNGSSSYAGLSHWQERIEVIGNIHENPKLLEVAN